MHLLNLINGLRWLDKLAVARVAIMEWLSINMKIFSHHCYVLLSQRKFRQCPRNCYNRNIICDIIVIGDTGVLKIKYDYLI